MYEAFLVALWAALCGIDKYDVALNFHRPLITGPVIGFILGDVQTGLIAGAAMELAWLGLVPNAGSQPPDVTIGAIVGTAFAIKLGITPEASIGMAIPAAMAMQALVIFLFTSFSPVMQKCDRYAEQGNASGIDRMLYFWVGKQSNVIWSCSFFSSLLRNPGSRFYYQIFTRKSY